MIHWVEILSHQDSFSSLFLVHCVTRHVVAPGHARYLRLFVVPLLHQICTLYLGMLIHNAVVSLLLHYTAHRGYILHLRNDTYAVHAVKRLVLNNNLKWHFGDQASVDVQFFKLFFSFERVFEGEC